MRRKPYFALIALPWAATTGYFMAGAISASLGFNRPLTPPRSAQATAEYVEQLGFAFERDRGRIWPNAEEVLRRNPFDSATGPLLAQPPPDSRTISASLGSRIHRLGPTQFIVERSAFTEMLEQMAEVSSGPPIVPVMKKGKVIGLRLIGVRPDTVFGALGLESLDLLKSLNGYDLSNPEAALSGFEAVTHAKRLSLSLSRGGGDMTVEYAIQ